jgi:hypothetical protein
MTDYETPEKATNKQKQCITPNEEVLKELRKDDPFVYFVRKDSLGYFSSYPTVELTNELQRPTLSYMHRKYLKTELAYRVLDTPSNRQYDKPASDSDSDSGILSSLVETLCYVQRKEIPLRRQRYIRLIGKTVTGKVKHVSPDKLPVVEPGYNFGVDKSDALDVLHEDTNAAVQAGLTTLESTHNPDNGACNKKLQTSTVAQPKHSLVANRITVIMEGVLGDDDIDRVNVGAQHSSVEVLGESNASTTIQSTRKTNLVGRLALRPKKGAPQVVPMAPGYECFSGQSFNKNIGKSKKKKNVSNSKEMDEYPRDDFDADREMYQLHDLEDRNRLKRTYDDADIHGPQLKDDNDD